MIKRIIRFIKNIKRNFRVFGAYMTVQFKWEEAAERLEKYDVTKLQDGRLIRECNVSIDISNAENRSNIRQVIAQSYEENIAMLAQLFKMYELDEYVDVTYDNLYFTFLDGDDFNNGNTLIAKYDIIFVPNSEVEPNWESYKIFARMKRNLIISATIFLILLISIITINIL